LSEPINPIPSDAFFITKRSYFGNLGYSDDSINLTANNLQFLDLAGTYFVDCNYKWYGLHNVKVLNFSDSKCSSIDSSFLNTF
jgi:hypothetical protein